MSPRTPGLLTIATCLSVAPTAAPAQHAYYLPETSSTNQYYGRRVAGIGDLDKDGVGDIVVSGLGLAEAGIVRVYSGADGRTLATIKGSVGAQRLGYSIAGVGDIDSNGHADFVVGAIENAGKAQKGFVRLYSGRDFKPMWTAAGPSKGGGFGWSVSRIDDVNNDGVPDIAASGKQNHPWYPGAAFVQIHSGKDGSLIRRITGSSSYSFGDSVAVIGTTLLVTAPKFFENSTSPPKSGAVFAYAGKTGVLLFSVHGTKTGLPTQRQDLGGALAVGGDFNGDKQPDFLTTGDGNWVRFYSGKDGKYIRETNLTSATRSQGQRLAVIGDINGDSVPEWSIGFPMHSPSTAKWNQGIAYLVSGKDNKVLRTFAGAASKDDEFGSDVAGINDINGDKLPDLLVGGRRTLVGSTRPGAAWVYSGGRMVLSSNTHRISLKSGGRQNFSFEFGTQHAGRHYWLIGSVTGTKPGFPFMAAQIPLNYDPFTDFTIEFVNSAAYPLSRGKLDSQGRGATALVVPTGLPPLSAFTTHHAVVVFDSNGFFHKASNPVPTRLY